MIRFRFNLNADEVYRFCNYYNWFTCGTSDQYERMFDYIHKANKSEEGFTETDMDRVCTIIWECSWSETDVEKIKKTGEWGATIEEIADTLTGAITTTIQGGTLK